MLSLNGSGAYLDFIVCEQRSYLRQEGAKAPQCQAAQESFQIWRLQPRGFHLTRISEHRFPVRVKKICLRLGGVLVA
jgi:hypothetical protein